MTVLEHRVLPGYFILNQKYSLWRLNFLGAFQISLQIAFKALTSTIFEILSVLSVLLILTIGLLPSLLSVWGLRRLQHPSRRRLQVILQTPWTPPALPAVSDAGLIPGVGIYIGDLTCEYNARSPHLRCAVNPSGPCDECSHYRSIPFPELPCH